MNDVSTLIDKAQIYSLPSDNILFWVGNRYAAAHYGRFEDRDNIYLSGKFADLLTDQEKAVVILHEALHLARVIA